MRPAHTFLIAAILATMSLSGTPAGAQQWKASTPELDAKIRAVSYTPQELSNIDTAMRFVSAHRPPTPAEKKQFLAEGVMFTRGGMDILQGFWKSLGTNTPGYSAASMNDRADTVVDLIAKGNRVWLYFVMNGHHTGPWFGSPGGGRAISVHESAYFTFKDGKIVEARFQVDELALAKQLGLFDRLPAPTASVK